jgi:hypothetical protein
MKTNFKIAWVDDNFSDPEMNPIDRLTRKLVRKNGFTLDVDDLYVEVTGSDFEGLLSKLASEVDLSNSIDLVAVDYQLGGENTGEKIAKKFRDSLPSVDILFYSGKESAENLRNLVAQEHVDNVNCVERKDLVDGAYTVIENIINRSHKISTLRGLVLNSVCEMDHMIREIICKYSQINTNNEDQVKNKAVNLILNSNASSASINRNKLQGVEELLNNSKMMSGKLFSVLEEIKANLELVPAQSSLLDNYRTQVLDLRTSAAHAKEATCDETGQSMLKFKNVEYKRSGIDDICKTIVNHEKNIQSILDGIG